MATMATEPKKPAASRPLTPSAAAARKRPPADRKPKQSTNPPPTGSQAATGQPRKRELDMSVDRGAVDVGFDFRPVPIRLGPGDEHLWLFNPDPSVDQWAAISAAVADYRGTPADELTFEQASEMVERIRAAIADLLYNPDDQAEFIGEKRYGPMALLRLAAGLMEEVTGFPTQP